MFRYLGIYMLVGIDNKKIRTVQDWQVLEKVDFVSRWEGLVVQSPVFQLAVDLPLVLSSLLLVQPRKLILSHY